jgi:hypothetical protein
MEKSKKIAILIGVGGVIGLGLYLLKKSKPTLSQSQLTDLKKDTITKGEEQLILAPSKEVQLQRDKCDGLTDFECEQLIAKLDIEKAIATGTPIKPTYISESGNAPRVNVTTLTRAEITALVNSNQPIPTNIIPTNIPVSNTRTSTSNSNPRVSFSSGRRN